MLPDRIRIRINSYPVPASVKSRGYAGAAAANRRAIDILFTLHRFPFPENPLPPGQGLGAFWALFVLLCTGMTSVSHLISFDLFGVHGFELPKKPCA